MLQAAAEVLPSALLWRLRSVKTLIGVFQPWNRAVLHASGAAKSSKFVTVF